MTAVIQDGLYQAVRHGSCRIFNSSDLTNNGKSLA